MRFLALLLSILFTGTTYAHEVLGTVEVLLKGDKKKNDLSSVVVYLEPVSETHHQIGTGKQNFSIVTRNKQFAPRILAVPAGASVQFPNYDSIFHNIFSVSAPNRFDLGLYKGGASKTHKFQHPGIVKVFCNVHPQMSATIVVSSSSYFTIAAREGNFSLGDIPNGLFQIRAYAEEGQVAQKIEVGDKPLKLHLTIDGRNFKKVKHKNKFGKDYDENERY